MDESRRNQGARKLAVFGHYAPWNWVVSSSAYTDEFIAETRSLIIKFAVMGLWRCWCWRRCGSG